MLFVYPGESDVGPTLDRVQAMNRYNEELLRTGALLAGDGLTPPSAATRVTFKPGQRPRVIDGPFTEAKELVGGDGLRQARSHEAAVALAARAPIGDGTIEVRRIAEDEDYSQAVAEARQLSRRPPEQTVSD